MRVGARAIRALADRRWSWVQGWRSVRTLEIRGPCDSHGCALVQRVLKSNACAAAVAGCLGADRRWRSVRGLEIGTDVGDPRAVRLSRLCVCPTCVHKSNARAGTGVAVVWACEGSAMASRVSLPHPGTHQTATRRFPRHAPGSTTHQFESQLLEEQADIGDHALGLRTAPIGQFRDRGGVDVNTRAAPTQAGCCRWRSRAAWWRP